MPGKETRKRRFSRRTEKKIALLNAVVWTLMIAVWLHQFWERQKFAAMGFCESSDVVSAGVLALASIGLAAAWWLQWIFYDKKNQNN